MTTQPAPTIVLRVSWGSVVIVNPRRVARLATATPRQGQEQAA